MGGTGKQMNSLYAQFLFIQRSNRTKTELEPNGHLLCLRAGGCGGGCARLICVHVSVVIFIPSIDHRRADVRVDKLVSSLRQQPHLAFVHAGILRPLLDLTLPGFSGKGKDRAIQLASAIEGRGCRGRKGRPHPNPTESIDGMDPNTRPPTAVVRV